MDKWLLLYLLLDDDEDDADIVIQQKSYNRTLDKFVDYNGSDGYYVVLSCKNKQLLDELYYDYHLKRHIEKGNNEATYYVPSGSSNLPKLKERLSSKKVKLLIKGE